MSVCLLSAVGAKDEGRGGGDDVVDGHSDVVAPRKVWDGDGEVGHAKKAAKEGVLDV
eukprot:CAMPEP_0170148664 /NCGR_PEP_ID=MMETSP0033_2-20121228/39843_1 /TAXON_ID=195969 /ORGANISM="Dolichomastix tenuilepis, Strain CCMP3274" /LENGTH=56 /DNA_ID=CAMNT_0010385563 /DNA_START=316 /DNA_END=483 /DNA_ORIENTATION=-